MEEILEKQGFHYESKNPFKPITTTVTTTIRTIFEESKTTTAAFGSVIIYLTAPSFALANTQ